MVFIVNIGSNGLKKECIHFFLLELISSFDLSKEKQNSFILIFKLNFIKVLIKNYQSFLQNLWCEA